MRKRTLKHQTSAHTLVSTQLTHQPTAGARSQKIPRKFL